MAACRANACSSYAAGPFYTGVRSFHLPRSHVLPPYGAAVRRWESRKEYSDGGSGRTRWCAAVCVGALSLSRTRFAYCIGAACTMGWMGAYGVGAYIGRAVTSYILNL